MTEIFDDIRGIYDFSPPCEELSPFIEFFSESSREKTARLADNKAFKVEMFPSWTPTMWFNFETSYRLSTANECRFIPPDSDVLVLRDSATTRHNTPADHLFSVKFFPGGLEAILGVRQPAFIGHIIPLSAILPARLIAAVKSANSFPKRCSLLQDFFLDRYAHRSEQEDHYGQLVRKSIGSFDRAGMALNTSQIAEKHFVHSRTINRYFHRTIGLSPKKYFAILRARTALTSYLADRKSFSPGDFGFYDSSHFYRATRQFTGRRIAELS